jgi:predicted dehydrogenase
VAGPPSEQLGLGLVGAGRFGAALLEAAAEVPGLRPVAVADRDPDRARALAATFRLEACDPGRLLADPRVQVVAIATTPDGHAALALAALRAGRHVFCEKPLATTLEDAGEVLAAATAPEAPRLTVDYVLRRNPLYALVARLQQALLGPPRRFSMENLAGDEHLGPDHWFWDRAVSGGIAVEHGVHFFDAGAWLLGSQPEQVQALEAARPDGRVDTVLAAARHPGGATASYTHSFGRPERAESQWTTLDWGQVADGRLYGWIPVELELDIRTDGTGLAAVQALTTNQQAALAVDGYRPSGGERITLELASRAQPGRWDLRLRATLGGQAAKSRVYRESVRAGLADLVSSATTGTTPAVSPADAWSSLAAALAATEAATTGTAVRPAPLPG